MYGLSGQVSHSWVLLLCVSPVCVCVVGFFCGCVACQGMSVAVCVCVCVVDGVCFCFCLFCCLWGWALFGGFAQHKLIIIIKV